MATYATPPPPPYEMLHGCPTPPPTASSAYGPPPILPNAAHAPPLYKRKSLHTPPAEITPIGQHQFRFSRALSMEQSSRPSSVSGHAYAGTTSQESEDDDSAEEEGEEEDERPRVDEGNFELEEVNGDETDEEGVEVVKPDHCEDAKSDKSGTALEAAGITDGFGALQVSEESTDEQAQARERIRRRRKKNLSQGWIDRKRDHDRSVAGDSSYSDNDPQDDNNVEARRLRRKLSGHGPWDRRASLIFEDKGFPNTNNIIEEEEPEEGVVKHTKGPPSIPSDDAFTLDELPFWGGAYGNMEVMSDA